MIKYCYSKKANNYRGGDYNTGNLGLYNAGILTAITPLTVLKKMADLTAITPLTS